MSKAARSSWRELAKAGLLGARRSSLAAAVAVVPLLPLGAAPAPQARALPLELAVFSGPRPVPALPRPNEASPALADPPANIPRTAAMDGACSGSDAAGCQDAVVAAIDQARAAEHVRPLQLPANFGSLGTPAQLLVLADLERTDRGLPGFTGLSAELDSLAAKGASAGTDPQGPNGTDWGSNWAGGEQSALLADYDWMYDDGPGSPNLDCPKPASSGCWDHRQNILWDYGPQPSMGAAATAVHGVTSMTELFSSGPAGPLDSALPAGSPAGSPSGSPTGSPGTSPVSTPTSEPGTSTSVHNPSVAKHPAAKPSPGSQQLRLLLHVRSIMSQFQLGGAPVIPVARLIEVSAPVSGFGSRFPFGHTN